MIVSSLLLAGFGVALSAGLVVIYRAVVILKREISAMHTRQAAAVPPAVGGAPQVTKQFIHDLNNLLGTIAGFTDAAREDLPLSSPLRDDLAEVLEASERAKRLIKDLQKSCSEQGDATTTEPTMSKKTQSYPPVSVNTPPFHRTSSYPPVAKPVPPYKKPVSEVPSLPSPQPETIRSGLPFSDIGSRGAIRRETRASEAPVPANANRKEHLLIVDDELQLLTMFRRVFEPKGYQVTTFSNGLLAWDDFQKHGNIYDLAILDQRMPEMSGTSLAIEMLNSRPDFPIILLSGYSDTIHPDDAARIGIRKFLTKPIPQAELADTIRKTLDEPRYM